MAIAGGGGMMWLSARGYINLTFWLGVCGFKQRFGLPCPGCGWTHAVQMCVTGHPVEAFIHQPAAAFFCAAAALAGIYALLMALFGIDFALLRRLVLAVGVKILVITAIVVLLAGWVVTLVRVMMQSDGL